MRTTASSPVILLKQSSPTAKFVSLCIILIVKMKFSNLSMMIFLVVTFLQMLTSVSAGEHEKTLLDHLLKDYNKLERPVLNENDTVRVDFGLTLMSLQDMNIAQAYLETNIWLTLEWNDTYMKWNSSDYGGITSLTIPPHQVWTPDIYLYNSIHPLFDPTFETKVVVKPHGSMTYIPPGIFKSSCKTDVLHYPFDEQKCSLKFGSWTSHTAKIDLHMNSESGEISSFVANSEWELVGVPGQRNAVYYACCPDPYVDITFIIHLRRRGEAIFYGCSLALAFGAIAMVFSLLLPFTSGQRIILGVVTFLAIFGMGFFIHTNLGGKDSLMVTYFFRLAFLIFVSISSNILVVQLYSRNPVIYRMPVWLRKLVFDVIPPFVLLNRPASGSSGGTPVSTADDNRVGQLIGVDGQNQYEELVSDLQALILKMGGKQTQPSTINEWQYFAIVLDRLAFLFYLFVSVGFFVAFYCAFA